ncbi:MAG TPA: hypothetical protein VNV25_13460 [Gemmatimonadaceae bacterium]|jgi:hypothetical protein|nr:hypothetical protein [Gemmatimonadaceae bacterium]
MDLKREIDPPYDLWPGIRGRIRAKRRWRVIGPIVGLAAAAAIVLIVVYRPRSVIDVTQVAPATVRAIVDSADASNDARVERELLDELELRRGELRPETEASVRGSLRTIDSAITELRAELARRPNDPALAQLLAEAYAHKVDLMKLLANAS